MNSVEIPTREDRLVRAASHPLWRKLDPFGNPTPFLRAVRMQRVYREVPITAVYPSKSSPNRHTKGPMVRHVMWQMLLAGEFDGKTEIAVDSSGGTGEAVADYAEALGLDAVVYMGAVEPTAKKRRVACKPNARLVEVPSGQSVSDAIYAYLAAHPHCAYFAQYRDPRNIDGQLLGTVRALFVAADLTNQSLAAIAVAMGTGGTAAACGQYAEALESECYPLGVRPLDGQSASGSRSPKRMMEAVDLPWQRWVRQTVEVDMERAFRLTDDLAAALGARPGVTSLLALQGLCDHIDQLAEEGDLALLLRRGFFGVVLCPDMDDLVPGGGTLYGDEFRAHGL